MSTNKENITNAIIFQAQNLWALILAVFAGIRVQVERIKARPTAKKVCAGILAVLVLVLNSLISFRIAQRDAQRSFEAWQTRFVNDYLSMQEAAERGMPPDPKVEQEKWDIDETAKVLYGVKSNSETDLRTYCWAAFNRVDIKTGEFRDTNSLSEVYAKDGQFMGYSTNNPVIGSLRKIAEEEYRIWKSGGERPCDVDYVFIYWTPDKVMLLKQIGDMVHTWRYSG